MQESDDSLIERATAHDRAAFTTLYDRYVDRVYRHVRYRLSDRTEAEDVTQEVFVRAWKAIPRYRRTGAPFLAWLTTIAHNLIVDSYRAGGKTVSLEKAKIAEQRDEVDLEAVVDSILNSERVRDAIVKLKHDRRRVILMRFIDDLSYREIAAAINKSEGAVRVIQYRALRELRGILERQQAQP